ncbi:MAG: D-alanine--D-alanine ligase [Anaerolineaceae bacterium]|nr:MAG: D-alanine--D-alanine ligase [Anaerolineaceae bacterium]
MTNKKLRVAVLFGGRSGEHEVSLMSARSVIAALDPAKYEIFPVGITHAGNWFVGENVLDALEQSKTDALDHAFIFPEPDHPGLYAIRNTKHVKISDIDVYFPALHGTFGEDGTMQGLFELADVAYVGAGVVGSAVGMDKGIFKDVMRANNIPVVDWVILHRSEIEKNMDAAIRKAESLGAYPLFAKPANLGSSVGITKCNSRADLGEGLMEAAAFDRRILVERGVVDASEIEVSVLGNDEPIASVPGEVLPSREFYSYESKYVDGTSGLVIPAQIPEETSNQIRDLAVRAYKAIDCAGMARADFFLEKETGRVLLNELNTLPGFTSISMYPKLWAATGISYPELVDRLIQLALDRKAERDHTTREFRRSE